jgi:hypothetical protein
MDMNGEYNDDECLIMLNSSDYPLLSIIHGLKVVVF